MSWRHGWKWLALLAGGFLAIFHLPVGTARFDSAVLEAFHLVKWYARGSTGWVRRYLHWSDTWRGGTPLRYASGLLVLAGGPYPLYMA